MSRRRGPTLADRSAASAPVAHDGCGARHCVVTEGTLRWPGLLLEWRRRTDGGWEGLTAYATPDPHGNGVRLVQRWVPAEQLQPLDGPP